MSCIALARVKTLHPQPAGDAAEGHSRPGLFLLSLAVWASGRLKPAKPRLLLFLAGGLAGTRAGVGVVAEFLSFCSPYPILFTIEGKSYDVLVLVGLMFISWWKPGFSELDACVEGLR